MIILLLAFAIIAVYYAIKKININSKLDEYFLMNNIKELEKFLAFFNSLSEEDQDIFLKYLEQDLKVK